MRWFMRGMAVILLTVAFVALIAMLKPSKIEDVFIDDTNWKHAYVVCDRNNQELACKILPLSADASLGQSNDNFRSRLAQWAEIRIKSPMILTVGKPAMAELFVQKESGDDAAKLAGSTSGWNPGRKEIGYLVTASAEARTLNLTVAKSETFKDTQPVTEKAATSWAWTLTPTEEGDANLLIQIKNQVSIKDREFDEVIANIPQTIHIVTGSFFDWATWDVWLRQYTSRLTVVGSFLTAVGVVLAVILKPWRFFFPEKAER